MFEELITIIKEYEQKKGKVWLKLLSKINSAEDIVTLIKEADMTISQNLSEFAFQFFMSNKKNEISESELASIVGGGTGQPTGPGRCIECYRTTCAGCPISPDSDGGK